MRWNKKRTSGGEERLWEGGGGEGAYLERLYENGIVFEYLRASFAA